MVMSNDEVAKAFVRGEKRGKSNSMFIEGDVIFSYGYHFPIARWVGDNVLLFNVDPYSVTTSRHKRAVLDVIDQDRVLVIEVSTDEIKMDCGVIKRKLKPSSVSAILGCLRNQLMEEGINSSRVGLFVKGLEKKIEKMRFMNSL